MPYFVQIDLVGPSIYEGDLDPVHFVYAYDIENAKCVLRKKRFLHKEDRFASFLLDERGQEEFLSLARDGFEEVSKLVMAGRVGSEAQGFRHAQIQFMDLPAFCLPDYLFNPPGNDLSDRYEDYPDREVKALYRYFQKTARFLAKEAGVELPLVPLPQKGESDYRF